MLLKARVTCEDEGVVVVARRLGCRREAERMSLILNYYSSVLPSFPIREVSST